MCKVYLGLGSNQGDRINYLQQATQAIEQEIGLVEKSSSYYETEPWGFVADNKFINQVVKIDTGLSVSCVLKHIMLIERQMGRIRVVSEQQYSSREIDIDILFYDNHQVTMPDLEVPHPRVHQRSFVLEPMNEIAPDFVHPVYQASINSLLSNCDDHMKVRRLSVKEVFEKPFTSEINPDF